MAQIQDFVGPNIHGLAYIIHTYPLLLLKPDDKEVLCHIHPLEIFGIFHLENDKFLPLPDPILEYGEMIRVAYWENILSPLAIRYPLVRCLVNL